MVSYMLSDKKHQQIVTKLFVRVKNLPFPLLHQKNTRQISTHYFILRLPNKQEMLNKSQLIDYKSS